MNGIQMMLKAMGFDPVVFMQQIEEAKKAVQTTVTAFDRRLATIETLLQRIETRCIATEKLLSALSTVNQPDTPAPAPAKGVN